MPIGGTEVLIVVVRPWVLADRHEANLFVVAFYTRFKRVVILMAQDERGVPSYFGPTGIVEVLGRLPFELIPWQRLPYRTVRPASWKLPIPQDTPDLDDDSACISVDILDPRSQSMLGQTRSMHDWQEETTAR